MHLLNAAVAVASALVGTVGATVAYDTLNTPPVVNPEPIVTAEAITSYLPCEPPAELTEGVCLTTVVKTIVETAKPTVITNVVAGRSETSTAKKSGKGSGQGDDDEDDEDDDHEDDDDDHEDEDDDD